MSYCSSCGVRLEPDSSECFSCGAPVKGTAVATGEAPPSVGDGAVQAASSFPSVRRVIGGIVLAGVVVIITIVMIASFGSVRVPGTSGGDLLDDQTQAVDPDDSGASDGAVQETSTSTGGEVLPAACAEIYSTSYKRKLRNDGAVLNPDPSVAKPIHEVAGSANRDILAALRRVERLECRWLSASGVPHWGIETSVAVLTNDQVAYVKRLLAGGGFSALRELGGTRYVLERTLPDGSGKYGESHIVLGNYWFATFWSKYGPTGYTADIVEQVIG